MLGQATITNAEQTVYTVPSGKSAYVNVDIWSQNSDSFTIKVNNTTYYSESNNQFLSIKLALQSEDSVKVSTTGSVNVFVHGMEV